MPKEYRKYDVQISSDDYGRLVLDPKYRLAFENLISLLSYQSPDSTPAYNALRDLIRRKKVSRSVLSKVKKCYYTAEERQASESV